MSSETTIDRKNLESPRWDSATIEQALGALDERAAWLDDPEQLPEDRRNALRKWCGFRGAAKKWRMRPLDYLAVGLLAQGAMTVTEFGRLMLEDSLIADATPLLAPLSASDFLRELGREFKRNLRRHGEMEFRTYLEVHILTRLHERGWLSDRDYLERVVMARFREALEPFEHNPPATMRPFSADGRLDLRDLFTVTFDPGDSEAYDDALSLEQLEGGRRRLWVHVADAVARLVPQSEGDRAARKRGISVYLSSGRVLEMLPTDPYLDALSLQAGEDRLALSVCFDIDGASQVSGSSLHRTLIRVDHNLTFERARIELDSVAPVFHDQLVAIAEGMREGRRTEGTYRDLRQPEFDSAGTLVAIRQQHLPAIFDALEDIMIATNRVVGAWCLERELPTIYRGTLESGVVGYSTDPASSHRHLGIDNYLHFTSPLRRYADVVVGRSLHLALGDREVPGELHLEPVVEQLNERYRLTKQIERLDQKLVHAVVADRMVGLQTAGTVTGIKPYGVFVTTDQHFTGLIYLGRKGKPENESPVSIGDPLRVRIDSVNRYTGEIALESEELMAMVDDG